MADTDLNIIAKVENDILLAQKLVNKVFPLENTRDNKDEIVANLAVSVAALIQTERLYYEENGAFDETE